MHCSVPWKKIIISPSVQRPRRVFLASISRDSPAEKYFSWKSRKKKLEKAGGALNGKSRRILLFGRALVSRSASVV